MSAQYRLPCPECGDVCLVEAAQAGIQISCRAGHAIEVPTWRGLQQLERVDQGEEPAATWGVPQALMFWGGLASVGCLGLLVVRLVGMPPELEVNRALSFQQIESLSPAESWEFYQTIRQGLYALDEIESEQRFERNVVEFRKFRERYVLWNYVLIGGVVAGLALAGAGLTQRAAQRRRALRR